LIKPILARFTVAIGHLHGTKPYPEQNRDREKTILTLDRDDLF
jgi:hypothetical protein